MPKISLKKHVFGLVSFSMQPILETELTVKREKKKERKPVSRRQDTSF